MNAIISSAGDMKDTSNDLIKIYLQMCYKLFDWLSNDKSESQMARLPWQIQQQFE